MAKRPWEDADLSTAVPNEIHPASNSASGETAVEARSKLVHINEPPNSAPEAMRCSLPPHRQTLFFATYEDYEVHYNQNHINRCTECRKNFPTQHFLELHIQEHHDPLNDVLKDRGDRTYACFVDDCDRKCSTPQKRRRHLIDKHMFPKDYDFYVVDDGIDHRTSLLRTSRNRRRSSTTQHKANLGNRLRPEHPAQVEAEDPIEIEVTRKRALESSPGNGDSPVSISSTRPDSEMDNLTGAMSALKFVPTSIRFGRKKAGSAGFERS